MRSGCRWRDCPPVYGPRTTIFNRFNRWSIQGVWRRLFEHLAARGGIPEELAIDSTHIKVHRSARGSKKRGRDPGGRPVAFTLTPGNIADISVARDLLETLAPPKRVLADKAYDADKQVITPLLAAGKTAIIPPKSNRRDQRAYDGDLYKARRLIENFFCNLKQFRAML